MLNHLKQIRKYISYLAGSNTRHGTHSPFVYQWLEECLYDKNPKAAFSEIENLRKDLEKVSRSIAITDLGAGSLLNSSRERTISDIAKKSAKNPKFGRLLYRICAYFQPEYVLELGTSLGISSLYMAKGNPSMQLMTLEGCPNTAKEAKANFEKTQTHNIQQLIGDFKNTLPQALEKFPQLDLVFFDGNHQKEPTIAYFEQCLSKKHNDSLFIFDDIHWSDGMEEAWEYIKAHPEVSVTIDLFMVGLVFFRKEQPKEHFTIRF